MTKSCEALHLHLLGCSEATSNVQTVLVRTPELLQMGTTFQAALGLALDSDLLSYSELLDRPDGWASPRFFAQYFPSVGTARLEPWHCVAKLKSFWRSADAMTTFRYFIVRGHH